MPTVLLTGASGFVGREVAKHLLARGYKVHALGRRAPDDQRVIHHPMDLLSGMPTLAEIGATHLLHCAWYAEPGKFWTAPENCDWVAASLLLTRSFALTGGKRMVGVGSCAEYAWDRPVLTENCLGPKPATLYGHAKRSLFEILTAATPVLDLSIGWGRVFMPYGAREDSRRLLGTLIAARAQREEATFSSGDQIRDFMHVGDVAGALVALLESDVEGPVNIGTGLGTSVRDFVLQAAKIARMSDKVHLGARPARPNDPSCLIADVGRLTTEVGFQPQYTLKEGLIEVLGN